MDRLKKVYHCAKVCVKHKVTQWQGVTDYVVESGVTKTFESRDLMDATDTISGGELGLPRVSILTSGNVPEIGLAGGGE
jgi:hypothetical protein